MNRKIIKSVLNKKPNQWAKSIKDPEVERLVRQNTLVTGGAIASMLLGEDVKDFDLYFKDKATTFAVANYYVNEFNKAHPGGAQARVLDGETFKPDHGDLDGARTALGLTPDRIKIYVKSKGVVAENKKVLENPFEDAVEAISDADQVDEKMLETEGEVKDPYRAVFLSSNAITLADKLQLVIRFYGNTEEIHKNYDFVHCTNSYDFGTGELILRAEALECLMAKELRYMGSRYPLCSVIRTRKFIKRGFHINAGQYLKMCFQISKLDLTDIQVLEDQLVGVDSAYFSMLIDALRSKQEGDPSFKIEESYITSIIDRIF
jgi:hypothetical protein